MEITVSTEISLVNAEVTTFKSEDIVSGVIHVTATGKTTIIFDGGYVFGEFHCPGCAIKNLNQMICNYVTSKINCGIEYSDYKRLHMN